MYTITKEFHFSASHQLHGLPEDHQCARLHGHNYVVVIELRAEALNGHGFVRVYLDLAEFKRYIDDTLDADMIKLRETSDEATRKEIAKHFEAHLAEVSPWVWLYTGYTYAGMQADVQGYVPTPTGSIFGLSKVTLAE